MSGIICIEEDEEEENKQYIEEVCVDETLYNSSLPNNRIISKLKQILIQNKNNPL